jgi:uncharacterized repeat protein (TIGR04076 family)
MPFKVKATVVAYMGDVAKYPCHFQHKLGDEFIYDGERFLGRLCPSIASAVLPQMMAMHAAGPRQVSTPAHYYPFWYAPVSVDAPELKRYDGLGYRNVLTAGAAAGDPVNRLMPPNSFQWPPHDTRDVAKSPAVMCPDLRTAVVMQLEAFDLSDRGYDVPFFRRQMMILHKVMPKPGLPRGQILAEFTPQERLEVYPALSQVLIDSLCEELELIGYLQVDDGKVSVTSRGRGRLEEFRSSLPPEDRQALGL